MIQINGVHKSFGGQEVLKDISFNISPGEKIGFVGRNGSGKSTLFKIILGQESIDDGSIQIPQNYKIASLEQHIIFNHTSVLDECVSVLSEEEKYDHFKAEKILFGLGFNDCDLKKDPHSFSGGYQVRINLAKALLKKPDMLLLDEPTNYLDILSLRWLKKFLQQFPGEMLLITHDRNFMDQVITHTMGIKRNNIKKVKGVTKKYYQQMIMEDELYEQTRLNQEKKQKELQTFVDRFRAKASKASQAQSKLKQLEKMSTFEKLTLERRMGLEFQYLPCPAKILIQVNDLAFSYTGKPQDCLFEKVSFEVNRKDRIGIIGKNGKGKSTLLNILASQNKPTHGSLETHNGLSVGHFGQTNIQRLYPDHTITEEIQLSNKDLSLTQIRQICGAMMFPGDLADKKIKVLSGGERSRVMLGKILAHQTNCLMLDEPTNHLDMESVDILTDELQSYEGSILIVTHNEMMLRKLANKLIIFQNGTAEFFLGTYDDFLEKIGWEEEEKSKPVKEKMTKKQKFERQQEKIKALSPLKKKVQKLEKVIMNLEEKLEHINRDLTAASDLGKSEQIATLSIEFAKLESQINEQFEALSQAANELESKEKLYAD